MKSIIILVNSSTFLLTNSMAQVLSFPSPEGGSHFGNSSLHRSSSHSSLLLQNSDLYAGSSNDQKSGYPPLSYDNRPSNSLPSSAPSSPQPSQPQFSNQPSYTSTPSSSLSLDEECSLDNEDIHFPSYSSEISTASSLPTKLSHSPEASSSEVPTPSTSVVSCPSPPKKPPTRTGASGPAGDDIDLKEVPTRHVDYLSHNWKEEDIWSSWRHIVAKRKFYSNSTRLENASWRTWAKSRNRLKTVSPETLNWYVGLLVVGEDFGTSSH